MTLSPDLVKKIMEALRRKRAEGVQPDVPDQPWGKSAIIQYQGYDLPFARADYARRAEKK